jgi:hypothetical protein
MTNPDHDLPALAPIPDSDVQADIQVGILTKGKPTLGMVLTSLLLQEAVRVQIHVVDTSARPVITRDDVRFALRLAGDRGIRCSYDFAGESDRAFSSGKARLISELKGPLLCLTDDDVVLPSIALARLLETARTTGVFGYISPLCLNAPHLVGDWGERPPCTPGSLIYQDAIVHDILQRYYETTTDVLDQQKNDLKVWEPAFLTEVFDALKRPGIRQHNTMIYHLDYHEDPHWIEEERTVIVRSRRAARDLVQQVDNGEAPRIPHIGPVNLPDVPDIRGRGWFSKAKQALRIRS